MKNCLFIIGNGFDIIHGLKTSYFDLKKYVEKESPELYEQINNQLFSGSDNLWESFEFNVCSDDTYFHDRFIGIIEKAKEDIEDLPEGADPLFGDVFIQKENNNIAIADKIDEVLENGYEKLDYENLRDNFIPE